MEEYGWYFENDLFGQRIVCIVCGDFDMYDSSKNGHQYCMACRIMAQHKAYRPRRLVKVNWRKEGF